MHFFLWFMGSAAPPLELSLQPAAVANILMLLAFWMGSLRAVINLPTHHATVMSIVVLTAQYLLRVPPELAFTYSQSVILLAGSLDQLSRKGDFYSKSNGFLFFVSSLYHLPLFPLYYLEMFMCSKSILSKLGGHAVYDLYLSLAPFALYYVVIERKKKGD